MLDRYIYENSEEIKMMTASQRLAMDFILNKKSIFITGSSGTGKSFVISAFRKLYANQLKIGVTSTTGISALLIGGSTIHSFFGIGLGEGSKDALLSRVYKNRKAVRRIRELEILIIDEVSMLNPILFDKIEYIARCIRFPNISLIAPVQPPPFGGIQLIVTGDFLQLPVVGSDDFCFEANMWKSSIDKIVELTEIMRQDDRDFQECLNEIRHGVISDKSKKLLDSCINQDISNEYGIKPTKLYTTNVDVDYINEKELDRLATQGYNDEEVEFFSYEMKIEFTESVKDKDKAIEKYKKNCIAPAKLEICKGAQVMLLFNLDVPGGLANGSKGIIIGFVENFPQVRFANGAVRVIDTQKWSIIEDDTIIANLYQIPLKPCWAVTIHKSQGATLDCAEMDLRNVFAHGQAYVALSRVKNQKGLRIIDIDYNAIKAHPKALAFYSTIST